MKINSKKEEYINKALNMLYSPAEIKSKQQELASFSSKDKEIIELLLCAIGSGCVAEIKVEEKGIK